MPDTDDRLTVLTREFQHALSVGQLRDVITAADAAARTVHKSLDEYTERQSYEFFRETRRLEVTRAGLASTLQSSGQLCGLIANANTVGTKITARVRLLDLEKAKVSQTAAYAADVIALKAAVAHAYMSIDRGDWPAAAGAIASIRALPQDVIAGKFANMVVPSTDIPQAPTAIVEQWCLELKAVFVREFQAAATAKDIPKLTTFFQLFPQIGEAKTGLDNYSRFICGIIAEQSRALLTNNSQASFWYSAVAMKLFESISMIVTQHGTLISRYYGQHAMTDVVARIQREVDAQVGLIIDTFHDVHNLPKAVSEVSEYSYPYLSAMATGTFSNAASRSASPAMESPMPEDVSVVDIGDLVNELSAILNKWTMYCRFVAVRWNEFEGETADLKPAGEPKDSASAEKHSAELQTELPAVSLKLPPPLKTSTFVKKIADPYTKIFDALSVFYFRRSLEKAYQMEELPTLSHKDLIATREDQLTSPDQPLISSVVEDLILILNTSLRNAFETGQPQIASSIIITVKRVIDTDFLTVMLRRLRDLQPRGGYQFLAAPVAARSQQTNMGSMLMRGANYANSVINTDNDQKLNDFVVLLNSVSIGDSYFRRIVEKINAEVLPANYPFATDSQKLAAISGGLIASLHAKSTKIVEFNVQVLYDLVFKNKMRLMVNDYFLASEYLISQMDESGLNQAKFAAAWAGLISPFVRTLAKEIWDALMVLVMALMASLLEAKLWALENRINELGSIKLESNISGIIDYVTKFGKYSLKDSFLKVTQVVLMVGFDGEEEEAGINWVLTPQERVRARYLRVDRNP
ncbi:hypothetical protein BABINDRAFT_168806 [Babjeviella inositovora NRRL Y-12698]|uniref:Conserved oligomeric Golgi complex subunit 4 n=1 Tax=Babjeviella inositovora NRRL Y-12698 TaxID=984486 RepID=A0A1E3QJQ0_9ASCO|nr:uncharacterized protein BABINDRAFT_168806 [Babjeviella inositovora NRRL Y-12698]ODQ77848.1 hypothetical protein BABINDRAFT_168806 [Babjeviella inositovora NRRL Y-12698]